MGLTFVLDDLLGGHTRVHQLGVAFTLHIKRDELGWSSVEAVNGSDSRICHQLDGVAVASIAGRVPKEALSSSLEL